MLTKTDLDQIRKVIRQEVKIEVKDSARTLDSQIRLSRMQVQGNIGEVDDRIKNVEIKLDDVANNVKKTQKDISQMQQRKRIVSLEEHVGRPI
jgi:hypothetical protein